MSKTPYQELTSGVEAWKQLKAKGNEHLLNKSNPFIAQKEDMTRLFEAPKVEDLIPVGGIKHDQGKLPMELISTTALEEMVKVLAFGAKKYAAHNWRKGLPWSRVIAAILRHSFAYLKGETHDPETGLSHMAHVMCEAMFLLEFEVTHKVLDDRYKGPNNA